MGKAAILAIDQGTTNTKALLVDFDGALVASHSVGMRLSYPQPGWAEQCANDVWSAVVEAIEGVLEVAPPIEVGGIAISNQRETTVLWDAETGEPVAPAISWQCRRTAEFCDSIANVGVRADIEARTGLAVDPMFPSSKINWLLNNIGGAREQAAGGRLRVGTIDSWLLWKLTGGAEHATEYGNASRTQLFNLETLCWDSDLLRQFDVPEAVLPEVRDTADNLGKLNCDIKGVSRGTPIVSMMGDSHAALYAHGIESPGRAKVTIGTGSSVMTLTDEKLLSKSGLSSTIAWSVGGKPAYALEGNIIVAGNAVRFMSNLLRLADENELTELANQVATSAGVSFVPALAGLGAPHWNTDARGLIDGMSLGTESGHLARATLEAVAHQIADVVDAMDKDKGTPLAELSVDGGASRNNLIMQALACFTDKKVVRLAIPEASAMGAARFALAAAGSGRAPLTPPDSIFSEQDYGQDSLTLRTQWKNAVKRTIQDIS